jgi:5-methylcytosine-specific restriction endonuclease McrA
MNLIRKLSDTALLSETKRLVATERQILTDVLRHLREVDRRRLYSFLRYQSLFEYIVKELGYAEDGAYRRISAMHLVKEIPELETKIANGTVSLSVIGVVNQVIRAEAKSSGEKVAPSRKLELISAVENKSRREAEQIVRQMTTAPKELLRPEKIRVLDEHVEIRMIGRKVLEEKIQRAKDILSHSHPNISTADLFENLCDDFLARHDEKSSRATRKDGSSSMVRVESLSRDARRGGSNRTVDDESSNRTVLDDGSIRAARKNAHFDINHQSRSELQATEVPKAEALKADAAYLDVVGSDSTNTENGFAETADIDHRQGSPEKLESRRRENLQQSQANTLLTDECENISRKSRRKYIPSELKQRIWRRDHGRCQHCGSTRYIEIDHKIPLAQGGVDTEDNLRLLCRPCNQRAAIETLGQVTMDIYLEHSTICS